MMALDGEDERYYGVLYRLMTVCGDWKVAIESADCLWTKIVYDGKKPRKRCITKIKNRSAGLPLDLIIVEGGRTIGKTRQLFVADLLDRFEHRTNTVLVKTQEKLVIHTCFRAIILRLNIKRGDDMGHAKTGEVSCQVGNADTVEIGGFCRGNDAKIKIVMSSFLAWSDIVEPWMNYEARYLCLKRGGFEAGMSIFLKTQCKNISHLTLDDCTYYNRLKIYLPHLKRLTLRYSDDGVFFNDDWCYETSDYLDFPSIEILEVQICKVTTLEMQVLRLLEYIAVKARHANRVRDVRISCNLDACFRKLEGFVALILSCYDGLETLRIACINSEGDTCRCSELRSHDEINYVPCRSF